MKCNSIMGATIVEIDSETMIFTYFQHDIDIEQLDPRGRTPLMLATKLCHLQSLKVLIAHKANANAECDGWSGREFLTID